MRWRDRWRRVFSAGGATFLVSMALYCSLLLAYFEKHRLAQIAINKIDRLTPGEETPVVNASAIVGGVTIGVSFVGFLSELLDSVISNRRRKNFNVDKRSSADCPPVTALQHNLALYLYALKLEDALNEIAEGTLVEAGNTARNACPKCFIETGAISLSFPALNTPFARLNAQQQAILTLIGNLYSCKFLVLSWHDPGYCGETINQIRQELSGIIRNVSANWKGAIETRRRVSAESHRPSAGEGPGDPLLGSRTGEKAIDKKINSIKMVLQDSLENIKKMFHVVEVEKRKLKELFSDLSEVERNIENNEQSLLRGAYFSPILTLALPAYFVRKAMLQQLDGDNRSEDADVATRLLEDLEASRIPAQFMPRVEQSARLRDVPDQGMVRSSYQGGPAPLLR
jgi:hypothetical protein